MSKRISADFFKMNEFVNNYSLRDHSNSKTQIEECKAMHKKLYGLLIFVAEFIDLNKQSITTEYMEEMASDLLLSLFNWIQGMYKPAKLELRCSIENFLKSVLSISFPLIIEEKSVYVIFDLSKVDKHFDNSFGFPRLEQLRTDYSNLCRTVHSAQLDIHSMSALNLLPQYQEEFSQEIFSIYLRIVENYLSILFVNYPVIIDIMHPENKKDFLDCLSQSSKAEINKVLFS